MKKVFLSVLFLPLFAVAQDSLLCKLKSEKNDMLNSTQVSTGFKSIGSGSGDILLAIDANKMEVDFFFSLELANKCFDELSWLNIQFEGIKSKRRFRGNAQSNCKGYFHLLFRNTPQLNSNLERLATTKIISIDFMGPNDEKTEVVFNANDQQRFQQMVKCIIDQLPALREDTWKPKQ